jgi:L-fucose mutarotase
MLKTKLLHPEILDSLARAGHGSQILIADGNYPFSTGAPTTAKRVFLNLMPGMVKVTDVVEAILPSIEIEQAAVMVPEDKSDQSIFAQFEKLLGDSRSLKKLGRAEFYERARSSDTAVLIATGEQRIFANLLLTIGVVSETG